MKEILEIIPTITVEENTKIAYLDFVSGIDENGDNTLGPHLMTISVKDLPDLNEMDLLNSINNSNKYVPDIITQISKDKLSVKINLASNYIAIEGRMGHATHIFIPEKYNDIKITTDAIIKYYNEDYILVYRIDKNDIATCNNPFILNYSDNVKIFDKGKKWIVRIDIVNEEDISPIMNINLHKEFIIPIEEDKPFYMSSRSGKEPDYKPYGDNEYKQNDI